MKKPITLPKIVAVADIPRAEDVPTDNLINVFRVCTQMERVCTDNDGIGLSAVQVGIPWKLFVVLYNDKRESLYRYFLNCTYQGSGDKVKSIEGCLSLRGKDGGLRRYEVMRFPIISVTGKELVVTTAGLELKDVNLTLDGLYGIVHQHEIDHHNGVLISDIGVEVELY